MVKYGIYLDPTCQADGMEWWLHRGNIPGMYYFAQRRDDTHIITFDSEEKAKLAVNSPDMPEFSYVGIIEGYHCER